MVFVQIFIKFRPITCYSVNYPIEVSAISVICQCLQLVTVSYDEKFALRWMFPVFHVWPVCAWPVFQRNTAMETLNNISTTCVVESWRNHLFRFLNHLFWPAVESCHSVCRICHQSIVRCPCAIRHNINFSSRVECKCRLYHHWFPQKIYCLMNHILSTFFSSTHFYLIRHFQRFCWNIYFLLFYIIKSWCNSFSYQSITSL